MFGLRTAGVRGRFSGFTTSRIPPFWPWTACPEPFPQPSP
jgi:hypothetical protein